VILNKVLSPIKGKPKKIAIIKIMKTLLLDNDFKAHPFPFKNLIGISKSDEEIGP